MITAARPILLLLLLTLAACAPESRLTTAVVDLPPEGGSYSLILHGCNYGNDPYTIAFLWPEDQPYTFKPHSPAFQYRTREGLPAGEAMDLARDFVNCSPHFRNARLSAIYDRQNGLIGYELRPLYVQPSPFLRRDILRVYYRHLEDHKIRINIITLQDTNHDDMDDNR